jgi:subtilase family serine protease
MFRFMFLFGILLLAVFASSALPQGVDSGTAKRNLITQAVDNQKWVALAGNTRAAANATNDRGRVPDSLALEHMLLQLRRPAELEKALEHYTDDLQNPASPIYHQWLTAAQLGQKFGLAQSDIDIITNWLESQGFVVNQVYENKLTIDFSGSAGQVRQAFRTEIHNVSADGEMHIANMSDPEIPAALAPAVAGIVSLHNFMPRPMKKPRVNYTYTSSGTTTEAVVPADLATIYNLNPLFARGITGQGQTIAVIEDTDLYSTTDWSTFRNEFGLSSYTSGSFSQVHPSCADPGVVTGYEDEAILDAEWASAAAPGAAIEMASCSDTATTFGGLIALQNLLNASGSPPAVVSISYGECEVENGSAANASYFSTFQQAVAEGVSVFVSAGDEGGASCDGGSNYATHGVGVSGFASTPYNVAVGGTDFGDSYAGTTSTYWNATNTSTYGSAKSYIPEIPWNDSCGSSLLANSFGYSQSWGSGGFCNSFLGQIEYINLVAGSGGPSGCATGSPSITGVVSGSCQGYAKPAWQVGIFGNPSDGVRDIPDVSLFASNGAWGHYYVFCWSDTANGGASCSGPPSTWAGGGGTSFASPIMAGIQALVNQNTGSRWGNPNPYYYALAAAEYGSTGTTSCLSSNTPSSSCIFYDATQGDMDVVCNGTTGCYGASGSGRFATHGVLSTSSSSLAPAYGTGSGWDFATGLGSVNATNLVNNWKGAMGPPTVVSVSPNSGSGLTQTFTSVYSDPNGTQDLSDVRILFNTAITGLNACYVFYYPASNALYLKNNANNGVIGPLTPGSLSSLSNSQCILAGAGTSVSTSGNTLTVNFALTFTGTFNGSKNVYLGANSANASSGWVELGSWAPISGGPPTVVSLSPTSGTGTTQTFGAVYSDPNGAADLGNVRILFNSAITGLNACYVFYYPASNALYLENDANNGVTGPVTPGSSSSLSNSQCTLTATGTSVSTAGNNIAVNFALAFTSSFTGLKNVYLGANSATASSGWIDMGTWTP